MREPWLTKAELALELKVSTRTIERLGVPADLRVGGQNRYLLSHAEEFLAGAPRDEPNVVRLPRRQPRGAAA